MDIYRTIREYRAPSKSSNVISFGKGDRFEILESDRNPNKTWWGVRSMRDDRVGYVPSKYLQFDDRWAGQLPNNYRMERERNLQRLSDLTLDDQMPEDLPDPDPDYDVVDEIRRDNNGHEDHMHVPFMVNFDDWQKMNKDKDAENFDIPEPDYQDDDDDDDNVHGVGNGTEIIRPMYVEEQKDPQGLILPKKLPNPCLESRERQQLHREMLMNQKTGKDVLRQKSELRRELDRRRDTQKKKELDDYTASKRTSFELKLEEQANKLKQMEEEKKMMQTVKEEDNLPEFVKMKDRLKKKSSLGEKS